MKKFSKSVFVFIFGIYFPLISCNPVDLNIKVPEKDLSVASKSKYLLAGNVSLSDFDAVKFKTKLVDTTAISTRATVTLFYPSDYAVTDLRNTAISAGVTDIQGNFKFNPSDNFTPKINEVLVLEASNRVGGIGNANISLRTMVKWNGTGWNSITKPGIYINKKTTAISIVSYFTPTVFSSVDTMGRMTVDAFGASSIKYDEKLTSNGLSRVLNAVDLIMYQNLDPLEHIYSSDQYFMSYSQGRSYNASIQSNMHTLQTIVETYAVDWGGVYSDNITGLMNEAKSKSYWRNFKNPFTGKVDEILDYDEYLKIKETLFYKNTKLTDIAELRGFIIYKPETISGAVVLYTIYGLDIAGSFIKDSFGHDYYLTNQ